MILHYSPASYMSYNFLKVQVWGWGGFGQGIFNEGVGKES